MTTDVIITGFDSGVESWATETTLKSLINEIKDLKRLTSDQTSTLVSSITSNTGNNNNPAPIGSALISTLRTLNDNILELSDDIRSNNVARNNTASGRSGGNNTYTGPRGNEYHSLAAVRSGLNADSNSFQKLNTSILKLADFFSIKLPEINGKTITKSIMVLFADIAGELINQGSMYRSLYNQGVLFREAQDNSVTAMGKFASAATMIGLPFNDLSEVMTKYSRVVNREGLMSFANMAKRVSEAGTEFGLTTSESTEYLAEYMDQQRNFGNLHNMTQSQVIAGAQMQMKYTLDFSRAIGLTTKELEENRKNLSQNKDMQSALLSLPAELRKRVGPAVEQMIAGMGAISTPFANMMVKFVENPSLALGDELTLLAQRMGPSGSRAVSALQEFGTMVRSGAVNSSNQAAIMKNLISAFANMGNDIEGTELAAAFERLGVDVKMMQVEINKAKEAQANANKKGPMESDAVIQGMTRVKSAFTNLRNIFDQIIAKFWESPKAVDMLTNMLNKVSKVLSDNQGKIVEFAEKMVLLADSYLPKLITAISEAADFLEGLFPSKQLNQKQDDFKKQAEGGQGFWNTLGAYAAAAFVGVTSAGTVATTTLKAMFGDFKVGMKLALDTVTSSAMSGLFKIFNGSKIAGTLEIFIGGPVKALGGIFRSISGPLTIFFIALDAFKGMLVGISEFNTNNIIGSIGNIFLRITQGIYNGILDSVSMIFAAFNYAIYNGLAKFGVGEGRTWEQSVRETDMKEMFGGKEFFDNLSNRLTGNAPAEVTEKHTQINKETKTESTQTTESKNQQKITETTKIEREKENTYREKNTEINNKLASSMDDLLSATKQNQDLFREMVDTMRRLNTNLGNAYNNGAA